MKIMIGTPAYGGSVTTNYLTSIVRAIENMPDYIQLVVNAYPGDSLITRGRNTMVAQFMASDCDALLFIDADVGFDYHHITRLVGAGKDVVGGVYPIKQTNWESIVQAVKDNPNAVGYDDIAGQSFHLVTNGIGQPDANGFAPVFELGTGFMLIQRHVFETLREKNPDLNYMTDGRNGENFVVDNFFDAFTVTMDGVDGEGNKMTQRRYLSEDYAFCALWRQAGGEIFVDVGTNMLSHQGTYVWGMP